MPSLLCHFESVVDSPSRLDWREGGGGKYKALDLKIATRTKQMLPLLLLSQVGSNLACRQGKVGFFFSSVLAKVKVNICLHFLVSQCLMSSVHMQCVPDKPLYHFIVGTIFGMWCGFGRLSPSIPITEVFESVGKPTQGTCHCLHGHSVTPCTTNY